MQDKHEFSEFDLEDILSEFQPFPEEDSDASGDLTDFLDSLSEETTTEESPVVSDTIRMNNLISQIEAEQEAEEAAAEAEPVQEESPAVTMDTLRMNDLISQIMDETEPETLSSSEDTIRVENLAQQLPEQHEGTPAVTEDATLRMEAVSEEPTVRMDAVSTDATIRMDEMEIHPEAPEVSEDATIRMETMEDAPKEPSILYNPRTRLRELKKKLVAGPESGTMSCPKAAWAASRPPFSLRWESLC